MPSRIFMICNSYESGFGHGIQGDGLDLSKTPHADSELGEAYQIGYEAGQEARTEEIKKLKFIFAPISKVGSVCVDEATPAAQEKP